MAAGAERIILEILIVLAAAKIGGELAERFHQSSVIGELVFGVLIGPSLLGWIDPDALLPRITDYAVTGLPSGVSLGDAMDVHVLKIFAEVGVILLLFEVGLESNLKEMIRVGPSAILVGVIGIVVSFVVGYGLSYTFAHFDLWADRWVFHVFVGATLTATSVGITARVLADMGKLNTDEARIILGAAVFDDIGGLLILAIVVGLVGGAALGAWEIGLILLKAVGFLVLSVWLGILLVPPIVDRLATQLRTRGAMLILAFVFMLAISYLAGLAGLATIVGAFAGGLILAQSKAHSQIFRDIRPISALLVPFFFVLLGVQVDLREIAGRGTAVLIVGVILSIGAILAKLSAGWGVVGSGASRYVVGVGMAPRGEVGLIFAQVGLASKTIGADTYAAVVIVVMATTFFAPPVLGALFKPVAR